MRAGERVPFFSGAAWYVVRCAVLCVYGVMFCSFLTNRP